MDQAQEVNSGGPPYLGSGNSLGSAHGHPAVLVSAEAKSPALGDLILVKVLISHIGSVNSFQKD